MWKTRNTLFSVIAIALVLSLSLAMLAGCTVPNGESTTKEENIDPNAPANFVLISDEKIGGEGTSARWRYYVDTTTGVEYAMFWRGSNNADSGIAMTVLYNADGTPKVHPDYVVGNSASGDTMSPSEPAEEE